jgi:hypothetical protein
VTRNVIALAISTRQSYVEMRDHWDDRELATAVELLAETVEHHEKQQGKGRAGKRPPGAGGPQYSG